MKIKFKNTEESTYMTGINNIKVYDDKNNLLDSEIMDIKIHITPNDIITAECKFSVSHIDDGVFELNRLKPPKK